MKILAFTDIHSNKKHIDVVKEKSKKYDPDLLICSGDLTYFGLKLNFVLKLLNSIKKPIILIHGNHDDKDELKILCSEYDNLIYLHKEVYDFGEYRFIGYGGLGFSRTTKDLEKFVLSKRLKNKKHVLVFHQPPYGTNLDNISSVGHVGNKSITKVIKSVKPNLALSGHIHETFNKRDKIGNSILINPGQKGKIISI